jgi:hypothetical protein
MIQVASNNVSVARQYLRIKILGITIMEALAKATGGDAPLSLFLGDIPREGINIKRLEYYLPEIEDTPWVNQNSVIYQLLETGRFSEASFDMKNSPLAIFVYKAVPPEMIAEYLSRAQDFYSGKLSPADFLKGIDPMVVQPIARASSIMVYTRRQALLQFAGDN